MTYSAEVLADAPSGYYPLTTNAADSSGNGRNGTISGTLSFAGAGPISGSAAASGWSTGSITLPAAVYAGGAFTLEGWAKTTSTAWAFFLALNSNQGMLGVNGSSGKLTYVASAGVNRDGPAISDSAWHHVVITRDGSSNLILYVDGVSVGSWTATAPTATTITIGNDTTGANTWAGSVAHVALYPTALTAARVTAHYAAALSASPPYPAAVLTDSPLLYWRMNDSSGTTATDASGNSNTGTYSGSPTLGTAGLLNGDADKAITLTGANLVFLPTPRAPVSTFTIEALVKPSGVSGTQVVASMQDAVGAAAWTLRLEGAALKFYYWNALNNLQPAVVASTTFSSGTTYHVAATFTASGSVLIYVNGVQVGSASASTMNTGVSPTFRVGASGNAGEFFSGVIDEVAYYTSALTGSRVALHYATSVVPGEAFAQTATMLDGAPAYTHTYQSEVMSDLPLAYWRLDDTAGTTMADSSGNGHNGTYTGSPTLSTTGLLLNDTNTTVDFANSTGKYGQAANASWMNPANWTIEAVVKPTASLSSYHAIVSRDGSPRGWSFYVLNGQLAVEDPFNFTLSGATTLAVGATYHVAATYDGATVKLYVNGVLDGSLTSTINSTTTAMRIASNGQVAFPFPGLVDEVAYYGTALSSARITTHYAAARSLYAKTVQADSPLAYWRLGEAAGTSMGDASGNVRNGTYNGSPTLAATGLLSNDPDTAATFNGSSQYSTVTSASWMNASSFTVEAVINASSLSGARCVIGRDSGSGARGWNFYIIGSKLYVDNGAAPNVQGATTLSTGTKYHVAVTYDGTTVRIYLNGALDGSGTFALTTTLSNPVMIAASQAGSTGGPFNLFAGTLDEVAYYGAQLSGTTIASHYAAALGVTVIGEAFAQTATMLDGAPVSGYPAEILKDSPLLYWRFGDAVSSPTTADSSGNVRTGGVTGSITFGGASALTSGVDTSATLSGSQITGINYASWMDASSITVENWVKTTSSGTIRAMWDRDSDASAPRVWQFRMTATGKVEFIKIGGTGGILTGAGAITINDGIWHHVAATYDGSNIKIYVDGILDTSTPAAGALSGNASAIRWGANASSGLNAFWSGSVDEAAYYGTALSSTRIAAHYAAGRTVAGEAFVQPATMLDGTPDYRHTYVSEVLSDLPLAFWKLDEQPVATITATSASSSFPGEGPDKAFDGDPNTPWTTNGTATGYLQVQLSAARVLRQYAVAGRSGWDARNPRNWTFQGSNNGTTWTTLDTRTGIGVTGNTSVTYTFSNTTAYSYYKLDITLNNGDATELNVSELNLFLGAALDSSGNQRNLSINGTVTPGSTKVMPNTTSAFDFPSATSAYLFAASASWMQVPSFTIAAWVQTDTIGSYQCIWSRDVNGAGTRGPSFYISPAGKLNLFAGVDNLGTTTLATGTNYFVAATYNSSTSTVTLYVNGSVDATITSASVPNSGAYDMFVGVSHAASSGLFFPFDGRIDDVAYFPTALSGSRIAAYYNAGISDVIVGEVFTETITMLDGVPDIGGLSVVGEVFTETATMLDGTPVYSHTYLSEVLSDTPEAYYRLDETAGTTLNDSSGHAHTGTFNNTPTLAVTGALTASGDTNTAVTFTAASSEDARVANYAALTSSSASFSLEAWVKTTSSGVIVGRQGGTSAPYLMEVESGGKLAVLFKTSGTSGPQYNGTITVNDGAWHHLVAVRDGATNTVYLYVDGMLDTTITSAGLPKTSSDAFAIGSRGATPFFDGTIDEVAFYTYALSATRVAVHHGAAFPATISGEAFTAPATMLDGMPFIGLIVDGQAFSAPATMLDGAVSTPVVLAGEAFAAPATALDGTVVVTPTYASAVLADTPIAYYRMGDAVGSTVMADSSGNGHDGQHSPITPTLAVAGLLTHDPDTAADFNGTTNVSSVVNGAWIDIVRPGITVEAWVNLDTIPTSSSTTIAARGSFGSDWSLLAGASTFGFQIGSTGGTSSAYGTTTIIAGTTYHVVGTYDGTSIKIYINGTLESTTTLSGALFDTNSPIAVGAYFTSSTGFSPRSAYLDGRIDELAIYNYALSGPRVLAHRLAGGDISVNGEAFVSATTMLDGTAIINGFVVGEPFVAGATMLDGGTPIRIDGEPFVSGSTMLEGGLAPIIFSASRMQAYARFNQSSTAEIDTLTGIEGTTSFDLTGHTLPMGESAPVGVVATKWYTYEVPDDALAVRFHTRGTAVDTTIQVYRGLTLLASSDDDAPNHAADLTVTDFIQPSDILQIQVGVKVAGLFTLSWLDGTPPPYDDIDDAAVAPDGDFGSLTMSLVNGTLETLAGEAYPVGSKATGWLEFSATFDNDWTIQVTEDETATDTFAISIWHGTGYGSMSLVDTVSSAGAHSLSLTVPVIGGDQYFAQISSDDDFFDYLLEWNSEAQIFPPETGYDFLRTEVYMPDGLTKISELPRRFGCTFQEPLNTTGIGEVSIKLPDGIITAYPQIFAWGNIIKFFLGSKCVHGFRIQTRNTRLVDTSEYTGLVRKLGGPSVMYLLNDFIVKHDGKVRPDSLETRNYGWMSLRDEWYHAGQWDLPVTASSRTNPPGDQDKPAKKRAKYNNPQRWPDRYAKWIWANRALARVKAHPPRGLRYYRKNFTIAKARHVRIFAAADETYRLYLDGELILDIDNVETGYTKMDTADIIIGTGVHTIAVFALGRNSPGGDGNDSFIFTMKRINAKGHPTTTVIRSDATWEAFYGLGVPGWNRAQVLRNCRTEARARGNSSALRLGMGFTATTDTAGLAWTDKWTDEVQIGATGLELQTQLSEGNGFDVWVDPGDMTIKAWKRRGIDKSKSVTLEIGRNLTQYEVNEADDAKNTFLIHFDGGWTEYIAPGSSTTYGDREAFVALGNSKEEADAKKVMSQISNGVASAIKASGASDYHTRASEDQTGSLIAVDGARPFLDFEVGDTIKAPNEDAVLVPHRVLGLTCTEDSEGRLSYDPTLEETR